MPTPAGEVLEASLNSEKWGLGWQEGRRKAATREGPAESRGVTRGGSGWVRG